MNNTLYTESTCAEPYVYYSAANDTINYLVVQVYAELVYSIASIGGCSNTTDGESLALTTLRRNLITVTKVSNNLLYRRVLYACIVLDQRTPVQMPIHIRSK